MRQIAFAIVLVVLSQAAPPPLRQLTADDYARAERFLGPNTAPLLSGTMGAPNWLPDGRLWYRATRPGGGAEFVLVDPVKRTKGTVFDHAKLGAALAAVSNTKVDATRLPFQAFDLSKDGRDITMTVEGRRWTCSIEGYTCRVAAAPMPAGAKSSPPPDSVTSPDGRYAAYIRDFNLWVKDLTTGQDRALTKDGVKDFGYATNNAGWIKSDAPVLLWSPDSKKIATFQHDGRGVSDMYLVATRAGAPRLEAWKYPLPQDKEIFRIHRVVVEVEPARVVRLLMPPDQHRSTINDHVADGDTFLDVEWYPDASHLAFVSSSRDHKEAILRVAQAGTGEVRTVLQETSKTQFQSGLAAVGEVNWRVLPASREVLWWSQRDGWGHLYLYDLQTGALRRQVTTGAWNVAEVIHVDEKARAVYIAGVGREAGRDPYFEHLYRVRLDQPEVTLLTPENAHHGISLSPAGNAFLDSYSTPTTPPVSVLRDLNGKVQMELERADVSKLVEAGWKPPTPIVVKARDGTTDLHGLMFTPTGLDPSRRYPIVNYIYPGPWGSSVGTRGFLPARADHQALAELGFVVVAIDGMGTEWRSKAFADAYYGNMGDNTIPDQIAGMRELAKRHPYIDIDRAGIWGHSGGGFATASAMFRHPDFFKVGVSQAGNHDNRAYEDDWGERFQGLLRSTGEKGDTYDSQANQLVAGNLRGKLLLAHGAMDDNVPLYNTYLVVDALVKANKDFDLIIFPHQRHGFGVDNNYMMRRRWDYFVKHLLGAEPPREYQIGKGR
jgi:dipeptidyl aminopeptidase/acylaminoacyl peptidase